MFEKADAVIAAARACIGTPFRHQGRLPGVGLDCAGLGIVAAKSVGIDIKDFVGYPSHAFDGMLKKMFDEQKNLSIIDRKNASPGDVLLMRISKAPQHVAILSYDGYIIHAYKNVGKVVEQRIDDFWNSKIVAVYRFKL
jgi:cell wall-associated NlpC family hydrolase